MPQRACPITLWLHYATSARSHGRRRAPTSSPVMTMCSRPRRTSRCSKQVSGLLMWWCPAEEQLISEIPEPRHGKIRRIINSAIAQHRIGRVEPFVRALCQELLELIVAQGGGDLVADYVTPIPATVIAHLLGVNPADHARFAEWSDIVVQSAYATKNRREDGVDGEGLAGVAPDFTAYLDSMIAERKGFGGSTRRLRHSAHHYRNRWRASHRSRDAHATRVLAHVRQRNHTPLDRKPARDRVHRCCPFRTIARRAGPGADRGRGVTAP